MKSRQRLASAVLVTALAVSGCAGTDAVEQGSGSQFRYNSANVPGSLIPVAKRKPSGDFSGQLLDGATYRLAAQAGKVVVVNFWGTWCPPCVIETPQFDSVYRSYKSKGVTFVGIDTKDVRDKAKAFVRDNDITYPIVFDEQGETAVRIGDIPTQGMPFSVLIDKRSRVAAVYVGAVSPKDIEPVLDKLVAER